MARSSSCAACAAKLPKDAAFCPACGRPTGVELEVEGLETDDELDRQPITVEPERPHGLRNLAIAAAVIVGFVGGALILGRNDRKEPAAEAVPSTTTATTRPGQPTSSSSSSTTTSTIAPPSTSAWIELAPKGPLLPEPTGTVLYSSTPTGRLVRVDLDTGVVTVRRFEAGDAGTQFLLRGGRVVVSSPDQSRVHVLDRDLHGTLAELNLDAGVRVLPGPAEDELWVVNENTFGPDGTSVDRYAQRIRLDGTPAGPRVPLPPVGGIGGEDGTGQLLLYVGGPASTYVLDGTTGVPTRLLAGYPLAVDARRIVDLDCDVHLVCRVRVTERATGASRILPPLASPQLLNGGGGALSPDGRWLALVLDPGNEPGTVAVVDLRDGSLRRFGDARPAPYWGQAPSWSPDGRWLFWATGPRVYAWRAGSPGAVAVADGDLPELTTVLAAAP